MLLDDSGFKLEVKARKISGKFQNTWRKITHYFLNKTQVKKEVSRNLKNILS